MGRDVATSQTRERASHAIPSNHDHAKAAMNRGHTLAAASSLEPAIAAYTEASEILSTDPLTKATANTLGAALMNRSQLLHQLHGINNSHLPFEGYERAASVLRSCLDDSNPWPRRNLVGTLINHANLLLDLKQNEEAKNKAETAIAAHSFTEPTDPTDCELAVLATRAYCDAVGQILPELPPEEQETLATQTNILLGQGLSHIYTLRPHLSLEPFAAASLRLFRFGSQLKAIHQPHELEDFIKTHLETLRDNSIRTQATDTAKESIKLAIEHISANASNPALAQEAQDQLAATSQRLGALYQNLPSLYKPRTR